MRPGKPVPFLWRDQLLWAVCIIGVPLLAVFALEAFATPGRPTIQSAVPVAPGALHGGRAAAAQGIAAARKAARPKVYLRLERFALHDADTLTADILLPYGITWSRRKIRVEGYDAWETSTARRTVGEITADEIAKGARATDHAWLVLGGADAVYIEADEEPHWTYERLLGEIWFDPPGDVDELVNYGDYMRSRGHARPSDPVLEKQAKDGK